MCRLASVLLLLSGLTLSTCIATELDNREFCSRSFSLAADSLIDRLSLETGPSYRLLLEGASDLLTTALIERLHDRGYKVYLRQDTAAGALELACEPQYQRLTYQGIGQGLFRQGMVGRLCEVGGSCRLSDDEGRLLRTAQLTKFAFADTISFEQAEAAREGDDLYAPEMPATLFQRVVEPSLVVGITGTLVYLFFASR